MACSTMNRLDQWRREAYDYSSSSDRLGIVISRAIELLMVVMKNGIAAENLKYAVESLKWERNLAINPNMDGEGTLRTHVHRLCEAMELTMECVIEGRTEAASTSAVVKQEPDLLYPVDAGTAPVKLEDAGINDEINPPVYDISSSNSVEDRGEQAMPSYEPVQLVAGRQLRGRQLQPVRETSAASSSRSRTPPNNECNLCGARFVRARDLRRHIREIDHSAGHKPRQFRPDRERKFKCDECPAEYTRVDNLNRHKLTHEGRARRIKCPHCDAVLISNLNGHLRDVHHLNPYACETCGQTFGRLIQLNAHAVSCFFEAP